LHLIASGQDIESLFSAAAGLKNGQFNRKSNFKKANIEYRIMNIEAVSLIIKRPCHFGVVSYKMPALKLITKHL